MKNLKPSKLLPAMLVVMLSVLAASAQQPQPPTKSAESSQRSGTGASNKRQAISDKQEKILSACNAAVDELKASRILIDALETENTALKSRLEIEKRANTLLAELNETRRAESEALKATVSAKNETIAAKDAAIVAQDKLIEHLKSKKRSVWSRIADIAIGAAIGAVVR